MWEFDEPLEKDTYTKAGNILGIYFARYAMVEMWQRRHYYQQQEWQLTHIADAVKAVRRDLPVNNTEGQLMAVLLDTEHGLHCQFTYTKQQWSFTFSAQEGPTEHPDVTIQARKDDYFCAVCQAFSQSQHEHDPSPQAVRFNADGLWRFNEAQRGELAIIIRYLTHTPNEDWQLVISLAHARQRIAREG